MSAFKTFAKRLVMLFTALTLLLKRKWPWTRYKVFLDDDRMPSQIYGPGANSRWTVARTTEAAKVLLLTGKVTHISLDNDLGDGQAEGHTLLFWMIENDVWPSDFVEVHSANIARSPGMKADIERWFYTAKGKKR